MTARRPLLQPLVPLYRAAVAVRNRWYDDAAHTRTLRDPVLSIGSIAAGGAGKTPFLLALARLLQANGWQPDVLSRGYGRSTRGVLRVDPAGTARDFGDEPLMLARALNVPVYVGSSRYTAGRLAEAEADKATSSKMLGMVTPGEATAVAQPAGRRLHLLDDGFNHRALARTLDIVLLTREDVNDTLLPAGNLREPLERLGRADVLVLRADEADELEPLGRRLPWPRPSRFYGSGNTRPCWIIHRRIVLPATVPACPLVFSGIARPRDFEAMVRQSGIQPAGVRRFSDHHVCTPTEIDALCRFAHAKDADGFLTTAKDAVRLTPPMLEALRRVGPIAIADAAVDFQDPAQVWRDLQGTLQ